MASSGLERPPDQSLSQRASILERSWASVSIAIIRSSRGDEAQSFRARSDQGEFKNRRKCRSRRGNEAEVFFAPESASLRRRLLFLNTTLRSEPPYVGCYEFMRQDDQSARRFL